MHLGDAGTVTGDTDEPDEDELRRLREAIGQDGTGDLDVTRSAAQETSRGNN